MSRARTPRRSGLVPLGRALPGAGAVGTEEARTQKWSPTETWNGSSSASRSEFAKDRETPMSKRS